jgi:putative flippase GtrA
MKQLLSEALAYALVSTLALGVDFLILYVLVEFAGLHYLVAATISFVGGAILAYCLAIRLVFRFRRLADRRLEFLVFAGIGLIGLVINGAAMFIFVEFLGAQYLIAKVVAASCTFTGNFLARRWALFTRRTSVPAEMDEEVIA